MYLTLLQQDSIEDFINFQLSKLEIDIKDKKFEFYELEEKLTVQLFSNEVFIAHFYMTDYDFGCIFNSGVPQVKKHLPEDKNNAIFNFSNSWRLFMVKSLQKNYDPLKASSYAEDCNNHKNLEREEYFNLKMQANKEQFSTFDK